MTINDSNPHQKKGREIQLDLTSFFQKRECQEIEIITAGDLVRKLTRNHYRVKSQSHTKSYNVIKLNDANVWTCDCKDFMHKLSKGEDTRCKHITACQLLQKIQDQENKIEKPSGIKICPRCYSTTITLHGHRVLKNGTKRQKYKCKQCNYMFALTESGFAKISSDPRVVTEALNLVFSGMSYRNAADHISLAHQVKISHVSVRFWFKKYTRIMKECLDNLIPETSKIWSVDEMALNVKNTKPMGAGFYDWVWTAIDPQTRFVISSVVSKRRETQDARIIFQSGKEKSNSTPDYVITDALRSYIGAFRKEFDSRKTAHIKTKSLSKGFANRAVERYHNEVRAVIKAKRGLGNDKSAQEFADGYRIYHNFCRPHTGLRNKITPAEAAGINLNLGKNRIKDLIVKSAKPNNFVTHLGLRVNTVTIVNEKDCIRVTPKGWIEKKTWREINDILRLDGFSWLSNERDSCWIKLLFTPSS